MGWRGIRAGSWKATWISSPFGISDWQLFNLAVYPGESRDLAYENPGLLQRLITQWEAYAEDVGVILPESDMSQIQ